MERTTYTINDSSHQVVEVLAPAQESNGAVGCCYCAQRSASLGVAVEFGDDHRSHRNSLCENRIESKIEKTNETKYEIRNETKNDQVTFHIGV